MSDKISFQSTMIQHLSMEDEHISQYKIIINCEGHISHGQIFYKCAVVPKIGFMEFGKAEVNYSWPDEEKIFDTVQELFKHRNWDEIINQNK